MESFGFVAPKKIPRSEYLPAKLKPVRDKTPKGKPTLPDDKHLDANKPSRVSRIPLTFTKQAYQCTKGPIADNKGLTNKQVRKPSPKQKKTRVDEKTKTSNIPRRQHDTEKPVKETAVHENQMSNDSDLIEGRQNVQRVQHLNIDADFSPKCQSETNSKAKPIPTFGQIYRHNYITDWLLESVSELLDMSDNSIFSGPRIVEITEANDDDETLRNHIIIDSTQNRPSTPSRPEKPIGSNNGPQGAFKTTNQNVSDWLTSEFEHSTKDNESGYRSMSPPSKVQSTTKSKITENLEPAVLVDDTTRSTKSTNDSISSPDGSKGDSKVNSLNGRDTVIVNKLRPECYVPQNVYQAIPKINTDLKPVQQLKPDLRRNMKFPSTPNPVRKREIPNSIPVPSYVECPSEIIQKTTNFEGMDVLSSVADTEPELFDDLSQCTLEQIADDSDLDERDWSQHQCSSQASTTLLNLSNTSGTMTSNTWCNRLCDHRDRYCESERKWSDNYNYHDYFHHYCWNKEVKKYDELSLSRDHRERCKKCQNYRRHQKKKYRLSRPFETLRKRMSIRKVGRHRWKGMWKRTAERWLNWTKSRTKFKKMGTLQCLRSINWDNADVQTTIFVYTEMGTDAVANEQKSAEITASLRLKSRTSVCNKVEAGVSGTSCKSNKSRNKHANIGPSFFTGTNSSIIKKCIARNNHSAFSRTNINHGNVKSNVDTKDTATDAESVTENEFIHESTSIPSFVNDIQEIGTETDSPSAIVNKVTSATIYSSPNLFETVTHDVPQKIIACNNAGTSIRFTPSTITRSTDNMSCSSVRFKLCGNDTETQVTPARSVRVVSTGVSAISHTSQHSKPSIITDRTVPCRKIGNKEFSTVLTPKGTILSCTGTKITSVSSTSIENPYILPKQSAVVSTSVTVNNVDCFTARSLHYRGCKDVCLDTKATNKLYDEKASCTSGLGPHLHTAVSAMDLVEQVSFNGGSHHTKRSVVAEFHPEYNAASTNTITELTSKSVGRDSSGSVAQSIDNESRVDAYVQYSGFQDQYDSTNQGHQSACIGRSQLMSMRMLCDSATEAATQAQFEYLNAETKTTPRKHMSTSTVTSQYFLGDPVPANMMTHKEDPAPMLLCGCTQVGSPIAPPTQLKEMNNSYEKLPPSASNSKPINAYDGQTNLRTEIVTTKSQSCTASNNYEPNTVISSNLNAAKWMKGYPNIVEKDFQSIVDISRSTVSESLERASLVLENSKIRCEETKRLAHEKQSNHPAVNCVTPLPAVSNESVLDVLPAKEHLTEPTDSSQDCKMVDEITSDKIVPKEMKETVIQASPTVRDSGLDSTYLPKTEQKSASVLTSRYILADPKPCCLSRNINFGSSEACQECLFVYDQPRCIVHKHQEDAAIQRQPSGRDFEMNSVKQEVSRRSACLAACVTSSHARVVSKQLVGQILPREMDSVKEEQSNQRQEALSLAENVSRHSERHSNALIAEVHTSEEKASLKEVAYSAGVLTSQMVTGEAMQQCQRRSSDLSGGVLTPQAYKALYETTKSLIKDKSKSQTPIHSPVRGSITEKGTEKSVTQNQQNTCLHCCCNLNQDKKDSCSRSTQAVFEVMQMCPHCCFETLHEPIAENIDTVEEYVKSYLMTSCRYYTNMLTKQLDRVKENLKKHLTPPGESVCKAPSISKLLIEACTMKPSGRQDDCCQTIKVRSTLNIFSNPPSLMNALSATDFRENQDKQDLKTMYYMLSSIEGRVRRLKNNLIT